MIDIPCVIFAGGKSSRMGEDKSLLPFGDFPTLTQFQLNRLEKLFKIVYISCKSSDKFDFEANFIEDVKTENIFAPTAGFVAIFEELKCERFFALSVDSPFITEDIIQKLIILGICYFISINVECININLVIRALIFFYAINSHNEWPCRY